MPQARNTVGNQMTPAQAAKVIGCNASQVRTLIRKGKLKARRVTMPGGYYYELQLQDVRRYAKTKTSGWPRGQSRK